MKLILSTNQKVSLLNRLQKWEVLGLCESLSLCLPFSVERQEAEPAGIKGTHEVVTPGGLRGCGDDRSHDLQRNMTETEHQLSGGEKTLVLLMVAD